MSDEGAVRGWECTPTSEAPMVSTNDVGSRHGACTSVVTARGWRIITLYFILAILTIIIFVNIALTLWIISALKLTMSAIGPIKIVKGGIQLSGQSLVMDELIASSIASRPGQPIKVNSYRNFTVHVRDRDIKEQSKLTISRDKVLCAGRTFDIQDSHGRSVFHASRDEVQVTADALVVEAEGGVSVRSAIQTPIVRAGAGYDLEIESQTRSLEIKAPQNIQLESRAGEIKATSHKDIKLESIVGAIKFDASNLYINNLKEATISKNANHKPVRVYQLCVCATGKLFLVPPEKLCSAQNDDEICR